MTSTKWFAASVVAVACLAAPAIVAQEAQPDILKNAINVPGVNYSVYGPTQKTKMVKDAAVVGGGALRVEVSAKGPESYTVGASSPIQKPIAKGHQVIVAFWARAPKVKPGETFPIGFFGVAESAAPYTPIASGSANVTGEWAIYQAKGVAQADYPAGKAGVSLHLAAAKGVVDLGPVFVLDMGPSK